jgi:hypothetical protein
LAGCRWYAPSDKEKTKWAHLISYLSTSGALKDVDWSGSTPDEQMGNFAKSLLGMNCRFVEFTDLPSVARNRETGKFEVRAIVPMEYFGKTEVGAVREEAVGEVTL